MVINIRELRSSTKEVFSSVSRGETVIVTSRGKPCAKIIPFTEEEAKENSGDVFGLWKGHANIKSVSKHVRNLRKGRHAG